MEITWGNFFIAFFSILIISTASVNGNAVPVTCSFAGTTYQDGGRIPGCFKVFCKNGKFVQNGHIDHGCKEGHAMLDPHMLTFDGYKYDFMGTGEYILTQEGRSNSPSYSVTSLFSRCHPDVSCVDTVTFRNSPDLNLKMGTNKYNAFSVLVNNVNPVTVEGPNPTAISHFGSSSSVLAWVYQDCLRLLGGSKLSITFCAPTTGLPPSVYIYASLEDFPDTLNGLFGFFDGNEGNDFTAKSGTKYSLAPQPSSDNPFISSWEATSRRHRRSGVSPKNSAVSNCTLDSQMKIESMCEEISSSPGPLSDEEISMMKDYCKFDLCVVSKSSNNDATTIENYLRGIMQQLEYHKDVKSKTTNVDVIPEDEDPLPSSGSQGGENKKPVADVNVHVALNK